MDSLWRGTSKPLAQREGAALPPLRALGSGRLCRRPGRAPAGTSLCRADACAHTAGSSPLDATVIQLSLHQLKPPQRYPSAGSFPALTNSALLTLTAGPVKKATPSGVPTPQPASASPVQRVHGNESALLPADRSPQHIVRLLFSFKWVGNPKLHRYLDIPPLPPEKPFCVQSSVRSGSSRILYLGPRPKSFLKAKLSCTTLIKMTAECILSGGLLHI